MIQMTVRHHDQIYAFWRDTGSAQVRLEPGKAAERWSEFLTEAGIDKDALPSSIQAWPIDQSGRCILPSSQPIPSATIATV